MKPNFFLIIVISLFMSSCFDGNPGDNQQVQLIEHDSKTDGSERSKFYTIKKFVDGDTFWINNGSEKGEKIRFIGMNTPESRAMFGNPEEYYGKEAAAYVKKLIGTSKVRIEMDVDPKDRYGRTLAYIYLEDGTFLNYHLVRQGFAEVMTIQPNIRFVDTFVQAQKLARKEGLGIWAQ
jgi:micrococcal nuclease